MDKGQHLRLVFTNTSTTPATLSYVALATELSFHLSAQTEDSTTKDSTDTTGLWNEYDTTGRSGEINFTALVAFDNESSLGSSSKYLADFIDQVSDTAVDWKLIFVSGAYNRTAGKTVCSGKGKLTNLKVTAQNKQKSTYSGTLNIYGPVAVGTD